MHLGATGKRRPPTPCLSRAGADTSHARPSAVHTGGPALGSRDCRPVGGVGSDACAGGSNLYAVQGRLGLTFTIEAVLTTGGRSWTFTRMQTEEEQLPRDVFAHVAFAKR